jgi:hypothetical protein
LHLSADEAFSLLDSWKQAGTQLEVHMIRSGNRTEVSGAIRARKDFLIELASDTGVLRVDLQGAEFNGDPHPPKNSIYDSYLTCEFRNDDRCAFYVPRVRLNPLAAA